MIVTSRTQLKDYCLRRLGAPVIEINVDDDQVEDRISDAVQYWQEYHFDGTERVWYTAQIKASTLAINETNGLSFLKDEILTGETSGATTKIYELVDASHFTLYKTLGTFLPGETVTGAVSGQVSTVAPEGFVLNNYDSHYIGVSDSIIGIVSVFDIGPNNPGMNTRNIFDVVYQFRLTDLYDLINTDLIYYAQVKTHLEMLDMLLPAHRSFRYNRKQNRVSLDLNWYETFIPGDYVIFDCYKILDPEAWASAYNDMFLKLYATALIKRQWGDNMKKYGGIQLPGGVTLNGQQVYDEAVAEIAQLEQQMQLKYELPPRFFIG